MTDAKLLKIIALKTFTNENNMNLAVTKQIEVGDLHLSNFQSKAPPKVAEVEEMEVAP